VKKGCELSFGCTGNNFAEENLTEDFDGAVRRWRWGFRSWGFGGIISRLRAEVQITGGARASFGSGQVGSVALDVQDHVAGSESNSGVRMSGTIMQQEVCECLYGSRCAVCLCWEARVPMAVNIVESTARA
jgi:hypothetical protein